MFRKISLTIVSNAISFVVSAIVTFLVPKKLGLESYGYFQLYLFYQTYIGFLHFGWADGVFLRYGGMYYEELEKARIKTQFVLYTLLETTLGIAVVIISYIVVPSGERANVLIAIGLLIILHLPKTFLQYILQCTDRIKDYADSVILEKISYALLVTLGVLFGDTSFIQFIIADLIGKTLGLIYLVFKCKDIVIYTRSNSIKSAFNETRENLSAGSKLMFANIASNLIIGFVRLAIENEWDVSTFGKISLTLSVSNLLMVFIRAVALVMFPMLRRTDESKLSGIYSKMRTCLMIPLLGMLVFYYPAKVILSAWLPQYADSLIYMALLFPMCVFESKMSMLIETYMKTLRKEKWLLIVNLTTVGLSVACTGITVYWLHNLDLAVVSIVVLLAFRCVLAETLLSHAIEINVKKDIVCELALTVIFISASWFIGGLAGLAVYLVAYVVYLFIKRKSIAEMASMVRAKMIRS